MIPSTEVMGSVTTDKEEREKAKRKILSHDPNAHDIVEMLLGVSEESLCEICESNPKEYKEGKWCVSCKDDFKRSDNE